MKYYILIGPGEDGRLLTWQVTAEQIRKYAETHDYGDFAVIDGIVIKGFSNNLDVGRLKDE